MLAASEQPNERQLRNLLNQGPLLATPKYDGIRCLTGDDMVVSRTLKLIPNEFVRAQVTRLACGHRLDGELVSLATDDTPLPFDVTQSNIMSRWQYPRFKYFIFDAWDINDDYQGRLGWLFRRVQSESPYHQVVMPIWVFTYEELMETNRQHLLDGYEGTCVRTRTSPYKHGRATLREGYLLKIKPFEDDEALITGWTPFYRNLNPEETNALGLQERKHRMENKVVDPDRFGALVGISKKWGEVSIGTGFTDLQRCNPAQFLNKMVTYKYQPNHSMDKPHAATFKSVRHVDA